MLLRILRFGFLSVVLFINSEFIPWSFGFRQTCYRDVFTGDRVWECQPVCIQCNLPFRGMSVISLIMHKRCVSGSKLYTDLMRSSCFQLNSDKGMSAMNRIDLIVQDGFLSMGCVGSTHHIGTMILYQIIYQCIFFLFWDSIQNRQIFLFQCVCTYAFRKT